MEERPCAILLKFPGTNCDAETARALDTVGFESRIVPVSDLTIDALEEAALVVLSGGFSYGDYVKSGRLAKLVTQQKIADALREFRDNGGFLLGICNGFQILTELDLLPEASLVENTSGRYQCQWVTLENKAPDSPFLSQLPEKFEFPIAHAEGRLVTRNEDDARTLVESGFAALTYEDEVNGSFQQIAALQDESGHVFGLMPHPERFLYKTDHYDPDWESDDKWGSGYYLFRSLYDSLS